MQSNRRSNAGPLLDLALLFLFSLVANTAFGQTETGQIRGRVVDPAGAVVSGAQATVRSVDQGASRTVTTGEDGRYVVTSLQPGLYEVTVEAAGFAPSTQKVQVTVGAKTSVETALKVDAVVNLETIEVLSSGGVEVNTQTQEVSSVVSANQIRELPTVTRNPYDLVELSGNVSPGEPGLQLGIKRGVGYAINGQRSASTNILLDGADNNNTFFAEVGQSIPLEAVQEFRLVTSNFSAEYGRASGGIVNVVTKAGSNEFHGSVYGFNRMSRLASNSYNNNARGLDKGVFARNQFGYSVGGPVIKDRVTFFNSTEWTRVRSNGPVVNVVPTAELIAASNAATQQFFSPHQLVMPVNGRVFTVGEVINAFGAGNFNPATNAFAALPASLPAFGEVRYFLPTDQGAGSPQNSYQTVTRVDWNISDRTQLYGRYALESKDLFAGTNFSSPYDGFNTGQTYFNNNLLLSLTHTFSPSLISQTKVVYNRLNNQQPLGEKPVGPSLYFFASGTSSLGGSAIALPGYLPFTPTAVLPGGGPLNSSQVHQEMNYIRGRHQFRFGGQYIYLQDNRAFGAFQNAAEILGTSNAQALSNLVAGRLNQFKAAIDPQGKFPGDPITLPLSTPQFTRSNRYHDYAAYFNDAWQLRPGLTVNLGVRYEYYGVQHNKDEQLDSNFYFGAGANIYEQIRNGKVMRAPESPVGALWRKDLNNFAPRVGFAWDVTGDGRTSVRGGYGMAYERNFGNVTFNVLQNPPGYAVVDLFAADVPSLGITTDNFGPLTGGELTRPKFLPATSLRVVDPNIVNAYAHFWSVSAEREVVPGTVASVEYTGSWGAKLYSIENLNRQGTGAVYLGDASKTARLNPQYTSIGMRGNKGYSRYNALNAGIESNNLRHLGLHFTARYTYGVAKDNISATFTESLNNFNRSLLDPFNPELDYGYADFDIHHRFVSSFNWEIPFADKTKGLVNRVLGGWSLNGIFSARTGTPFTVYDCGKRREACLRLVPTGSVDFEGAGNPALAGNTPNYFRYIDLSNQQTSGYVNPVTGTGDFGPFPAGMTARNAFRGPGFWNMDGGLYKKVKLSERYSLQLRGEFFNLFNHANLFAKTDEADISTSNFVPAYRDGRRHVQLALKLIF